MRDKIIELPVHKIVVVLTDKEICHKNVDIHYENYSKYSGGSITSELRESCPDCGDLECYGECKNGTERDVDLLSRVDYNKSMDIVESMILSQARVGIDIESNIYLEALETTLNMIENNIIL